MARVIRRSDGTLQTLTDAEAAIEFPEPSVSEKINERVVKAPAKGFGGPTGKELFNGNR